MVSRFEIIAYTDVWGDENEGWQVNDQMRVCDDLCITDDASDQDVLTYLKERSILTTDDTTIVGLEWIDDCVAEISEKTSGFPLGRLMRV